MRDCLADNTWSTRFFRIRIRVEIVLRSPFSKKLVGTLGLLTQPTANPSAGSTQREAVEHYHVKFRSLLRE